MAPADDLSPADERRLQRDWTLFITLTFLFGFGFAIYNGIFQNFIKEDLNASVLDLGITESLREIPGLLTALLAGTLVSLAESRVAGLGLAIGAIGIGVTGLAKSIPPLIAISVFWSIGFHLYSAMQNAITLALAKGKEGGRHLGRMNAVSMISTIAGLGFAWMLKTLWPAMPYSTYYFVGGGAIVGAAALCMMLSTHAEGGPREPIVFRKEYGLYYLLTFLEGCRRQVFGIFAFYALVKVYEVPAETMLILQLVYSVLAAATAPRIGRLIDRVGERGPLTFYAVAMVLIFAGYTAFQIKGVLFAIFIIDRVMFSFSVGFTTYLHRIVRPGELTPSLAMGTTMNHVAAVTIPILGALLWVNTHDHRLPFVAGIVIAVVSLIATFRLPAGPKTPAPQPTEMSA